jgi:hypothetical protein
MTRAPKGDPDSPARKRLNAAEKRALQAATAHRFVNQYGRKAQKGIEPNDRRYSRKVERQLKGMKPESLDRLLRDDED